MGQVDENHHLETIRRALWSVPEPGYSNASVLIGAGFSRNAEPLNKSLKIPLWKDLAAPLIKELYPNDKSQHDYELKRSEIPAEFLKLAYKYQTNFTRAKLLNHIEKEVKDGQFNPGQVHLELLKLPWAQVFTTNYDTLLERANNKIINYNYETVINEKELTVKGKPRIVKIHGSMPSGDYILTEEDYRTYSEKYPLFVNTIRQALIENVFCLIGFSGDDPNFNAFIGWVRDQLKDNQLKIYFIDAFGVDEPTKVVLSSKNIVYLNIQSIFEIEGKDTSYHSLLLKLFKYLSSKQEISPLTWANNCCQEIDKNSRTNNRNSIVDQIAILNKYKESYPGWLILPSSLRNKFYKDLFLRYYTFSNYAQNPSTLIQQLQYATLYIWLHRINLISLGTHEIEWLYKLMVSTNYGEDKKLVELIKNEGSDYKIEAVSGMIRIILLAILKYAVLKTDPESVKKLIVIFKANLNGFTIAQQFEYYYLKVTFDILTFNPIEALQSLELWPDTSNNPEWQIKKASLFVELNKEKEASVLIDKSLEEIRASLSHNPKDYYLLSLESSALYTYYHCSRKPFEKRDEILHRIEIFKRYNCDIYEEIKNLEIELAKSITTPKGYKSIQESFDPNRETVTYGAKDTPFWISGFYFENFWLMPFEAGLPLTGHMTDLYSHNLKEFALQNIYKLSNTTPVNIRQILRLKFDETFLNGISSPLNRSNIFHQNYLSENEVKGILLDHKSYLNRLFEEAKKDNIEAFRSKIGRHFENLSRFLVLISQSEADDFFESIIHQKWLFSKRHPFFKEVRLYLERLLFSISPKVFWHHIDFLLLLDTDIDFLQLIEDHLFDFKKGFVKKETINKIFQYARENKTREKFLLALFFLSEKSMLSTKQKKYYNEILFSKTNDLGIPSCGNMRLSYLIKVTLLSPSKNKLKKHLLEFKASNFNLADRVVFESFAGYSITLLFLLTFKSQEKVTFFTKAQLSQLFLNFYSYFEFLLKDYKDKENSTMFSFKKPEEDMEIFIKVLKYVFIPNGIELKVIEEVVTALDEFPELVDQIILIKLILKPKTLPKVNQQIQSAIHGFNSNEIEGGLLNLKLWIEYNKKGIFRTKPSDEHLKYLVAIIKHRIPLPLASALECATGLVKDKLLDVENSIFKQLLEEALNLSEFFGDETTQKGKLHFVIPELHSKQTLQIITHLNKLLAYFLVETESNRKLNSYKVKLDKAKNFWVQSIYPEARNAWLGG